MVGGGGGGGVDRVGSEGYKGGLGTVLDGLTL